MLLVKFFMLLSLLDLAYSAVINHVDMAGINMDIDPSVEEIIDMDMDPSVEEIIDMDIDPSVEQDIDGILKQMKENGDSMVEFMLEEDKDAMLEDSERVERSVGEFFKQIWQAVPFHQYFVLKPFHPKIPSRIFNVTQQYFEDLEKNDTKVYYAEDFIGNETNVLTLYDCNRCA